MRVFSQEFQSHLDSGATTLCRCWLVTPKSGAALGFTDHDQELSFDGHDFRASSGMTAFALERGTGLSADNSQILGALTDADLTEADISAGHYDGAEVRQWLVNWRDANLRELMFRGFIGRITRGRTQFEAELRGLSDQLNQQVGRTLMRSCDADLGGARCGVDLSLPAYQALTDVQSRADNRVFEVPALAEYSEGWFDGGSVEWITGANAGQKLHVKRDTILSDRSREIALWAEAPRGIAEGDQVRLRAGCDRRSETCRDKFSNLLNFRGFPLIPGGDWGTSYASEEGQNDGQSLFG